MGLQRRKINKRKKVPVVILHIAFSLLIFACVVVVNQVRAQSSPKFGKPSAPAPNNVGLNIFTNDSDLVKLKSGSSQGISGSLVVASSTLSSAIIGDFTNAVSVSGVAGITLMPPPLPSGIRGAALYGYSSSAATSTGAYGYASGANSAGVVGEVRDRGYAGSFLGQVQIASPGALTVDDLIIAPQVSGLSSDPIVPGVWNDPGIHSVNGITATGKFFQGINATTGANYGLYGRSSSTMGLYAVNTVASGSASNFYGIRGETANTTQSAGLFGYSILGNGIVGINGAASTISAVKGEIIGSSRGATDYSSAVYGRGGAFAGYFEGDVKIQNGLLYINKTGITEAVLEQLLIWACTPPQNAGTCDPY